MQQICSKDRKLIVNQLYHQYHLYIYTKIPLSLSSRNRPVPFFLTPFKTDLRSSSTSIDSSSAFLTESLTQQKRTYMKYLDKIESAAGIRPDPSHRSLARSHFLYKPSKLFQLE